MRLLSGVTNPRHASVTGVDRGKKVIFTGQARPKTTSGLRVLQLVAGGNCRRPLGILSSE